MTTYVAAKTFIGTNISLTLAHWQTFISEVQTMLQAVLVQTADTGQITPAVGSFPSTNTDGGYQIYQFNDSRQSVDPIFLKVVFRRNSGSQLALRIQIGQGSDGAGTLTGTLSTLTSIYGATNGASVSTGSGQDTAFHGEGNFWLAEASCDTSGDYQNCSRNYVNIARTRNDAGAFDGAGAVILSPQGANSNGSNWMQFVRWGVSPFVGAVTGQYAVIVGTHTSDVNGSGEKLAWPHFYWDGYLNQVRTCWATWTVYRSGFSQTPTSFNAAPYGITRIWTSWTDAPRAHCNVGTGDSDETTHSQLVMLWE